MWLFNSSIGRKVVMAVTGMALILFLTFHCAMNIVALFSKDGYNMICELLGANWYAVAATIGLAALALIHIIYAFILNVQNRRARGSERYAVTDKPEKVEWSISKHACSRYHHPARSDSSLVQLLVQHDVCRVVPVYPFRPRSSRWLW